MGIAARQQQHSKNSTTTTTTNTKTTNETAQSGPAELVTWANVQAELAVEDACADTIVIVER